jgi:hypothetical protein
VIFILEPSDQAKAAIGKRVMVRSSRWPAVDPLQGCRAALPHLRHAVTQAAIVENKRLGAALAFIREQQLARAEARSRKAPRRRDQRDARLFKVG